MKKKLLIAVLLVLTSCSYFRENYREVSFKTESGSMIHLVMFESTVPFRERSLIVYGNDYPLRGSDCADAELKLFSDRLWSKVTEKSDLSKLNVGNLKLLQKQIEATPTYCNYLYAKNENGQWVLQSIHSQ